MAVRVGINGFGRIGRNVFRAAHERGRRRRDRRRQRPHGRRDAGPPAQVRLGLRAVPGRRSSVADGVLVVDGNEVKVLAERDPADLPWGDLGVDVVIESTGFFTERADAAKHIDGGRQEGHHLRAGDRAGRDGRARRELRRRLRRRTTTTSSRTRPAPRTASRRSPRSCTTLVGIEKGLMTTSTPTRRISACRTRRTRTCAAPAPPRSTSPRLDRRREGDRPRDPGAQGQAPRLRGARPRPDRLGRGPHVVAERETTVEEINAAVKAQADNGAFEGILRYTEDPIVSSDIVKSPSQLDLRLAS